MYCMLALKVLIKQNKYQINLKDLKKEKKESNYLHKF